MSAQGSKSTEVSLREHLDPSQITCLNEAPGHQVKSILSKDKALSGAYLESDADEQLLINVVFNQNVRIKSLVLKTNPENVAQGPKVIKLFTNRPSIGFEDVEDADEKQAAQILTLSEDDVREGKPVTLRFVKFQHVSSLHIFVQGNQGEEDTTRIDFIDALGSVEESTRDLSGLRNAMDE